MTGQMLGRDTAGKRLDPYGDGEVFGSRRKARRYSRHVEAQAFAAYVRAVTS